MTTTTTEACGLGGPERRSRQNGGFPLVDVMVALVWTLLWTCAHAGASSSCSFERQANFGHTRTSTALCCGWVASCRYPSVMPQRQGQGRQAQAQAQAQGRRLSQGPMAPLWMAPHSNNNNNNKKQEPSDKKRHGKKTLQDDATTPLRVTGDSNISIRTQIKWARLKKQAERASSDSFRQVNVRQRTKYRRTVDDDEWEAARLERRKRSKEEPDWDAIFNITAKKGDPPLLLVDGYNVIYKWPELKQYMTYDMMWKARETLVEHLEQLHHLQSWKIECVFDGAGWHSAARLQPTSMNSQKRNKKNQAVQVTFARNGASADSYIASRCLQVKQATNGTFSNSSLIVATDDGMIRNAALNAGAECMSSLRLVQELQAVPQGALYRWEVEWDKEMKREKPTPTTSKRLGNSVNIPAAFANAVVWDDEEKQQRRETRIARRKKRALERKQQEEAAAADQDNGATTIPLWAIVPNHTKTF